MICNCFIYHLEPHKWKSSQQSSICRIAPVTFNFGPNQPFPSCNGVFQHTLYRLIARLVILYPIMFTNNFVSYTFLLSVKPSNKVIGICHYTFHVSSFDKVDISSCRNEYTNYITHNTHYNYFASIIII